MKKTAFIIGIALMLCFHLSFAHASGGASKVSADEAVSQLKDGNGRYVAGSSKHPNQDQGRRALTTSDGQHPIATVLSCSDSRVPVEILFDSGIGDIFVIRVAGNVADVDEVGSIEYGVDHLGTPVLLVLGHTHCGAVTAVVEKAALHGNIPPLVDNIRPAVAKARGKTPRLTGDALIEEAVRDNVWQAIEDVLKTSHATRERVKAGTLKIVGAVYDIDSGKIEWMGTHPKQDQLMARYAGGPKSGGHKKARGQARQ